MQGRGSRLSVSLAFPSPSLVGLAPHLPRTCPAPKYLGVPGAYGLRTDKSRRCCCCCCCCCCWRREGSASLAGRVDWEAGQARRGAQPPSRVARWNCWSWRRTQSPGEGVGGGGRARQRQYLPYCTRWRGGGGGEGGAHLRSALRGGFSRPAQTTRACDEVRDAAKTRCDAGLRVLLPKFLFIRFYS